MLAGLITKRICWSLTWRGRMVLVVLLVGACWLAMIAVHPFLSVTERVPARLLVIEGWGSATTMQKAAEEFRSGGYEQAVLVRPVLGLEDQYESGRYTGNWRAALLVRHGVSEERLTVLFPNVTEKDRTYHAALAVKQWLEARAWSVKALDVATQGPHARRSRLLYQQAFGDDCEIGIIALQNREYDPAHWWRTSEGVREVIGELIAYVYARFLFDQTSG